MTAELAKQLNVRRLIMTHFSQRYRSLSHELKVICVSQHLSGICADNNDINTELSRTNLLHRLTVPAQDALQQHAHYTCAHLYTQPPTDFEDKDGYEKDCN